MTEAPTPGWSWRDDVRRLFDRHGHLSVDTCPALASLVRTWLADQVDLDTRRLEAFVRSALWQCDRREARSQTGSEWTTQLERRANREAVHGYLFLPRMDESVGVPRTVQDEALVRGADLTVDPTKQAHRQRWAALRRAKFEGKPGQGRSYKSSTLFELGRRAVADGTLVTRLIEDLEETIRNESELVLVLADAFRVGELRHDLRDIYFEAAPGSALDRYGAFYNLKELSTAESEANVETHRDASVFIADVTIPDGMIVPRGTTVTKTWRIQNAGTEVWMKRRLQRVTPQTNTFPVSPSSVPIPDTVPGAIVDISVPITTTHVEGTTEIRFKMVDYLGNLCFPERYRYGLVVVITTQGPKPCTA